MSAMERKIKLGSLLANPGSETYNQVLSYLVFESIKENKQITLNQLCWLLNKELLQEESRVKAAVLTLVSIVRCIRRWSPPKSGAVHLSATIPLPDDFIQWQTKMKQEYPELMEFVAPKYAPVNTVKDLVA